MTRSVVKTTRSPSKAEEGEEERLDRGLETGALRRHPGGRSGREEAHRGAIKEKDQGGFIY